MLAWLTVALAAVPDTVKAETGLPQLNVPDMPPQLIWLALTFSFLYLILSRITLPRIASVIEERQTRIQRDLDEAERLKSETDEAINAYEQEMAEARARAKAIARETHEKLADELGKERAAADAEIASRISDAQGRILQTKENAMRQVGAIATNTAAELMKKLAGVEASQAEINVALAMQPKSGE